MKKLFTFLSLSLFCLLSFSDLSAQIRSVRILAQFKDLQGNPFSITQPVFLQNTDSINYPNVTTYNRSSYQSGSYYYDSCGRDTNYTDSSITVNYYACGQWNQFDTFFRSTPHWQGWGLAGYLNVTIVVPCYTPCNAAFNTQIAQKDLRVYVSGSYINGWKHHWDFGNGQTDSLSSSQKLYADTGTYIIRHIVTNPAAGCADTAWDTVSMQYKCNGYFAYYSQGGGNYSFNCNGYVYPYKQYWDMGDGTIHTDSTGFFYHQYNSVGSYTVKHVSYVPGYCADTFTTVINNNSPSCNFGFNTVTSTGYTVTVTPTHLATAFLYDMGDGTKFTKTGVFKHTYSGNGSYTIKIQDVAKQCTPKTYTAVIAVTCNTGFFMAELSPNTIRFRNPGSTPGTSWYYFGDGDSAQADTVDHVYASGAGYYTVRHEIYDGAGNLICKRTSSLYFNSCGYSSMNPNPGFVRGRVRFNDTIRNDYDSMMVYLIFHDSVNATLTAIDSLVVYNDSGYYNFDSVCYLSGTKFLVKAALLPGSSLYNDFLPTYGDSSVLWSGAKKYLTGYTSINMRRGSNPGGPGFIGGYISMGANKKGDALDGIQVTVLRSDGTPMAYALSANAGRYEFNNLALGDYRVLVEIAGKPSQEYTLSITPSATSFDNLDFEVNTMDITLKTTSSVRGVRVDNIKLYPNPADHSVFVEWPNHNVAGIKILDMNGKVLAEEMPVQGQGTCKIDVSSLSPGVYLIQVNDGADIVHQRITIR